MPDDLSAHAGAAPAATAAGEHDDINAWLRAGFDVHPCLPPEAPLHPRSSVRPEDCGKAPGVLVEGSDMWTGVHWNRPASERAKLQRGELWPLAFAAGNGGIRTGTAHVGVDIDVLDPALSARLRDLALGICGPAPVRVGQAPKCLLVYTAARDEPPQPTRVFRWRRGTEECGVEILGTGRQFVCKGVHPKTGQPYTWDSDPILAAENGLLSPITGANVRNFIDAMRAIMVAEGFAPVSSTGHGRAAGANPPPAASLRADDMKVLASAVSAIPNDPETPREAYIDLGTALKAAAGPDREMDGFLLWHEWAERWEPSDPSRANTIESCEADWARMKPPFYIGADYIFDMAARHGWQRLPVVRAAFAADPLPDEEIAAAEAGEADRRERPEVVLGPGSKDAALDAIGVAVARAHDLFRSPGGELLAIRRAGEKRKLPPGLKLPDVMPLQELATPSDVFLAASRTVTFLKIGRRGEPAPCEMPREMAKDFLLTRRGEDARPLLGFAAVPDITDAGEIIGGEGYVAATGRMHLPCPAFDVPARPTADDVRAALAELSAPFAAFSYSDTRSGPALVLALVLTAIRRPWLPLAPMFVVTAPEAGTGKGLLVKAACGIAFGAEPTTFTLGEDRAEQEKRFASALLVGSHAVLIDNCNAATIQGDLIEAALTAGTISVRPLGQSRQVQVSTTALLTATGNGTRIGGDMTRRALLIDLDPQCERPELRSFAFNPREVVRQRRAALLRASFTLLRAHRQAGSPGSGAAPLGSFEAWSQEVRDLVVWIGLPDPVATMATSREADPRRAANGAVLAALHARHGAERFTASDVMAWARGQAYEPDNGLAEAVALVLAPGSGRMLDARAVGRWAERVERTVFGGLRLLRETDAHSKANKYRVEVVQP
jgi:putative DNA primase/helicase